MMALCAGTVLVGCPYYYESSCPPVAYDGQISTAYETPVEIALDAVDCYGDTEYLTYWIESDPRYGTLDYQWPLTYTPECGFNGTDSFTFYVDDGEEYSNSAIVTITVGELPNNPPIAYDGSISTAFNTQVEIELLASDPDGDELMYWIEVDPVHGGLNYDWPLVYTPDPGFSGQDSLQFSVDDGVEYSNIATVIITVARDPEPVNHPPVAYPQEVQTAYQTPVNIVLSGDDPDTGTNLEYRITTSPVNGELSPNAGGCQGQKWAYKPHDGFSGSDLFAFVVTDGKLFSEPATVTITVGSAPPVNHPPTANSASVNTAYQTAVNITLNGNDVDGDVLTFVVTDNPNHGTLDGTAPSLVYVPNAGYSGTDSFTFYVDDGQYTGSGTVTITVGSAPEQPTTVLLVASGTTDPLTVLFTANASFATGATIVLYEWDLNGDGVFEQTTTEPAAWHTYAYSDSYRPRVRVTDSVGGTAENSILLAVPMPIE